MHEHPRTRESLVTAREVADLLGVTTSWVYEQSGRGRIPTVTLGRYRRYGVRAIEAWVEGLEAPDREMAAGRSAFLSLLHSIFAYAENGPGGRRFESGRSPSDLPATR
jgi:excisionase family DNA binding protein